jgi:hypothetical protein
VVLVRAVRRGGVTVLRLKAPEWIGATMRMTGRTRERMVVVSRGGGCLFRNGREGGVDVLVVEVPRGKIMCSRD